jgi:uncharacterized SAM-binding protein YcdF (DUF218 family)
MELFAKGNISFWLVSYENKKIMARFLQRGLDTARICIVDTCANTRSEIAFLKHWLETDPRGGRYGIRGNGHGALAKGTIGVVSNWYHMRRIQLIVGNLFGKDRFSCLLLAVPNRFDAHYRDLKKNWWRQRAVRAVVLLEWKKIVYYIFKRPLLVFSMISIG